MCLELSERNGDKLNWLKIILVVIVISSAAYGAEIKGDIYGEYTTQTLNKNSAFNKNNVLKLNELKYIMRGDITIKNEFNPNANGLLKLEGEYRPADYNKETVVERIYIKEAYVDLLNDVFNARIGKQFIKWGNGVFFNPADVVNVGRDPLKPVNEAEGSPFVQVSIPFQSFATLDILGVVREKTTEKASEMPIAAKISGNLENLSGFGYLMVQENKHPVYGFDANYVLTINNESDICLYTEGSYKTQSTKQYINSNGETKKRNGNGFIGIAGGARYTVKFPSMKRFDSLMVIAEYCYDNENWTKKEYKNMIGTLENKPANGGLYVPFKAAQNYVYVNTTVSNAFLNQMGMGVSAVINCEDVSGIIMPGITYQYTDSTEIGFNGKIFCGKNNSEFGGSTAENEFGGYTRISF